MNPFFVVINGDECTIINVIDFPSFEQIEFLGEIETLDTFSETDAFMEANGHAIIESFSTNYIIADESDLWNAMCDTKYAEKISGDSCVILYINN